MQAIMVSEFGGPEVLQLRETEIPVPGPGEVLVRVVAAGVGPWDVSLRRGGGTGSLPYIPGGEFAGYVEGDTAPTSARDGDPVLRLPGPDRLLRRIRDLPGRTVAPIPAGLSV